MSSELQAPAYFVGWDVGGWNCDKNGESRDTIVILNASLAIVGKPWRGNQNVSIKMTTTSLGGVGFDETGNLSIVNYS